MLFGELIDDFEKAYMPRLAKPTQLKYTSLLRCHVRPFFESMEVPTITTRVVDGWLASKMNLSWATRSDLRNVLSSIYRRAETWETYTGKNPAQRASPGRKRAVYEKRKLSVSQTRALLESLRCDVRLICMVGLFCGLRISEVLGLMWKHIDFERDMLLIRQRYYRGDLDRTKTDASDRDIPFGDLRELLRSLYPGDGSSERYCFQVRTCRGITRDDSSIRRYFLKPAAQKLRIHYRGFGFHAFRREAVTEIAGKSDAIQASRVAGHTRMDVTLLYGLDDYERQARAIKSIQQPFVAAGLLKAGAK